MLTEQFSKARLLFKITGGLLGKRRRAFRKKQSSKTKTVLIGRNTMKLLFLQLLK
jgi:hypothetical protein